jgi:DNA (cytosine-5)-methyltransferase 1
LLKNLRFINIIQYEEEIDLNRGGKRQGAGRKQIQGKEYRIKIEDDLINKIDLNFHGTNINDKIRDTLNLGLEKLLRTQIDSNKEYTVLDLFSGAGGLSRGFLDAGYNVVLGVDFDEMALKTFEANHGGAKSMKLDLFNHENIKHIEKFLDERNIELDVLVGGPPCQGFSLAGPREMDDERNTLYTAMVKVAEKLKPKAIILENVPGLLKLYEGKGAERIVEDFSKIGYKIIPKILYAPEFGVPQIRKRVFFVGLLDSEDYFEFPEPIYSKENFISCEEAISDLPALEGIYGDEIQDYPTVPKTPYQELMRMQSAKIFNHIGTIHSEKTVKLISMVPEGKNYKSLPVEYSSQFKYNEALTRYHSKKPSLTINTGHRSHFHYRYNRIPTVRESARLQSFPDDFIFYGNKTQQYKQVGNAVPPILGYHIARKLEEYLDKVDEHEKLQYS